MLLNNKLMLLFFLIMLAACGEPSAGPVEPGVKTSPQQLNANPESLADKVSKDDSAGSELERLEESLVDLEQQMGFKVFSDPWTGDLDVMVEHRMIRVLTIYSLGRYYLDQGQEKGLTYEFFKMFEDFVNEKMATKHLRIHVVFIPVARDQLIPGLISGRGDIVSAGLTITPERDELIDFSIPVTKELSEVLVTGPTAPQINTLDDLAGHKIYVRASSSYRSSIDALNLKLQKKGLEGIVIKDASELLEDEDLLEMVNAGLLNWVIVDDYKAGIWAEVFEGLTIRKDLVFRTGGRIGVGFRENSPQLAETLSEFLKTHKQGTLKGNILINRYVKDFDWTQNALAKEDYQRFRDVVDIFAKFGSQYGVDYLMVAAQGYQESRLDQNARSSAGAIGIMQLLPSTAADSNVGIPDISNVQSNIHAGVKYLDFIRKRYFSDPEINPFNKTMFAFAAYNAGPARVRKLRNMASAQGYDPNVWFDNVEVMAAREIGRETVQYVANILKYFIAYSLTIQQELEREKTRKAAGIK